MPTITDLLEAVCFPLILALGWLFWIATPGDAHAAGLLTPEGETVFLGLLEWLLFFAPFLLGLIVGWLGCSICWLLGGHSRRPDPINEFEGERL